MVPNDCVILLARLWIQLLRRYCTPNVERHNSAGHLTKHHKSSLLKSEVWMSCYDTMTWESACDFHSVSFRKLSSFTVFQRTHKVNHPSTFFVTWFNAFYWPEAVWIGHLVSEPIDCWKHSVVLNTICISIGHTLFMCWSMQLLVGVYCRIPVGVIMLLRSVSCFVSKVFPAHINHPLI